MCPGSVWRAPGSWRTGPGSSPWTLWIRTTRRCPSAWNRTMAFSPAAASTVRPRPTKPWAPSPRGRSASAPAGTPRPRTWTPPWQRCGRWREAYLSTFFSLKEKESKRTLPAPVLWTGPGEGGRCAEKRQGDHGF